MTTDTARGSMSDMSENVLRVPGSDVAVVSYFVKASNPPCVDCGAPAMVLAVFNRESTRPVCAVDAAHSAADGATILRFEDEDCITRKEYPEETIS